MEEADYYDEFGNYTGPLENDIEENDNVNDLELDGEDGDNYGQNDEYSRSSASNFINTGPTTQVTLHEDKNYFPSALQVYGSSVQVMVEEEDSQPLTEPIIAPIKEITVDTLSGSIPSFKYSLK